MAKPLRQVPTANQRGVLSRCRYTFFMPDKGQIPHRHQRPQIVGKSQVCGRGLRMHRIAGHHKRIERGQIIVAQATEMIVRESRVEVAPGAVNAIAHRAVERRPRPPADSSIRVRGDVRAVHNAERCLQRPAASIGSITIRGVTGITISERG